MVRDQRVSGSMWAVVLPAAAVVFWWPTLFGGRVPVAAVYQQQMPPFAGPEARGAGPSPPLTATGETPVAPTSALRAWDALLWDSMAQFYPWRLLLHRGLRRGELPLWNPHQYCGYPFVGNGQSALFYPPNWLLLLWHPQRFLGISLALHWALAGLLTFLLARAWGLRPPAAALAGLIYQSSGFMITWAELPTAVNVMAGLPGAWLGVEWLFRRAAPRSPAANAEPTPPDEPGAILGVASRGAASRSRDAVGGPPGGPPVGTGTRAGFRPGCPWPSAEPSAGAPQGKCTDTASGLLLMSGSLGMAMLAGHLQFAAYVWLTTALYAVVRVISRWVRRRRAPVAWLALAAALGLGLGMPQLLPSLELRANSPRGETQVSAEGWRFQQQRALRPVELLTFLWPEALGDPVTGTYPGLSYTEHCGYAGVLAVLLALLGLALRRDRRALFFAAGAALALWYAMAGPPAYVLYFGLPGLSQAGGFARILGVYTLCLAVLAAMGLEAVLEWLGARRQATKSALPTLIAALVLALVAAELFPWGWRFLPLARAEQVYPDTALTRLLAEKGAAPNDRVLAITPRRAWSLTHIPPALLPPNADTVYGWYSPQGYDSLSLASYRAWAQQAEGADVSPLTNGNMMLLENADSEQLRCSAVRWVASTAPLSGPSLRQIGQVEGVFVYEKSAPRPPFSAPSVRDYDGHLASTALEGCTLNTVSLATHARGQPGATTVLPQAFYPGWRAYEGTTPIPVKQEQAFCRLPVSLGEQHLWLAYYPASVVVGLFVGLVSLGLAVAIGLVSYPASAPGRASAAPTGRRKG